MHVADLNQTIVSFQYAGMNLEVLSREVLRRGKGVGHQ